MSEPLQFHFNTQKNIQVFSFSKAEDLEKFLQELRRGFSVKSIYGMSGRHYAWIDLGDTKIDKRRMNNGRRS